MNRLIKRVLTAFFCIAAIVCHASQFTESDVHQSLRELDRSLSRRNVYKAERNQRIDSLKTLYRVSAGDTLRRLGITIDIARNYDKFNNDSALFYYTRGLENGTRVAELWKGRHESQRLDSLITEFRIRRATYLSLSGFINDAISEYNAIDTTAMEPGLKATYLESGRQMFSYISSYYLGFNSTYDYWNNRAIEAQHSLLPLLEPGSDKYLLNLGEYYYTVREYTRAYEVLTSLVRRIGPRSPCYAIATHTLAAIAQARGDRNEYFYYLSQSAISDLLRANLEVVSLQELAGTLYETGDKRRAHEYIRVALNNAVESRASVRVASTSRLLTIVDEDHNSQIAQWRTWMYSVMIVLLMCVGALIVSVVFLRRQLRRVARMRGELRDANATKDIYIGQFMTLCSIYMDKLKQFSKLANRKISAGQIDELYKLTKSNKFIEDQSVEFYQAFDEAFLHIYPNFVDSVNALLRPEERITLGDNENLNTDLRILAFMRLGIYDTNRVAQILNLSVNTIYAYRNRLRNRAINRATFEQDILAINSFSDPDPD